MQIFSKNDDVAGIYETIFKASFTFIGPQYLDLEWVIFIIFWYCSELSFDDLGEFFEV